MLIETTHIRYFGKDIYNEGGGGGIKMQLFDDLFTL